MAPSASAYSATEPAPRAMTGDDIQRVRQAFSSAAQRAHRLGLDAIEIHAAHGYLLHEFLSPLANQRSDEYGGSLSKRMRFPLEVFESVREAVPASMAVGVRVSATDWVEGGWDVEQTVAFGQRLRERGCDFIHVSSGGLSAQQKIPVGPGYQLDFARQIRQASGLPTMAVGLITEAAQAEQLLQAGDADLVAMARAFLYQPRWGWQAAAALGGQVEASPVYWRAPPREAGAVFSTAMVVAR